MSVPGTRNPSSGLEKQKGRETAELATMPTSPEPSPQPVPKALLSHHLWFLKPSDIRMGWLNKQKFPLNDIIPYLRFQRPRCIYSRASPMYQPCGHL